MKPNFVKYLCLILAIGAVLYIRFCHFKPQSCIDPVTTYNPGVGTLLIEPDSTVSGITQIKVKVTSLDPPGIVLLDTTLLPGEDILAFIPEESGLIQVAQQYLNGSAVVAEETDNFRTAGIIIGVDVVIRPPNDPVDPYYEYVNNCCTAITGNTSDPDRPVIATHSAPANSPLNFSWPIFANQVNVLGVTISNGGTATKFVLVYDSTDPNAKPMLYGPCEAIGALGNCPGSLTAVFNSTALSFDLRFYKINPGADIQVEIKPTSDCTIQLNACSEWSPPD
jgi:hypothetical protein